MFKIFLRLELIKKKHIFQNLLDGPQLVSISDQFRRGETFLSPPYPVRRGTTIHRVAIKKLVFLVIKFCMEIILPRPIVDGRDRFREVNH